MANGYTKPYKVWANVGPYEAWVLRMYGSEACRLADYHLTKFFSYFPKDADLRDFSIVEVTDYKNQRLAEGVKLRTIEHELRAVSKFWKYLRLEKGYPLANPVKAPAPRINRNPLNLEGFKRLYSNGSIEVQQVLLAMLIDKPVTYPKDLNKRLRWAAKQSGLTWVKNFSTLRRNIKYSLWRDIARRYYNEICDALFFEAKPFRDPLADIEAAAIDIRPPVNDCDGDPFVCAAVAKDQVSP